MSNVLQLLKTIVSPFVLPSGEQWIALQHTTRNSTGQQQEHLPLSLSLRDADLLVEMLQTALAAARGNTPPSSTGH